MSNVAALVARIGYEDQAQNCYRKILKGMFVYFVKWPTKAQLQLIYKLLLSYMFRHYRVIFRELVFITSPSYISTSIAAVGNTI